jgi:hypothetical protein
MRKISTMPLSIPLEDNFTDIIADRRDRNSFESLNEQIPIGGFSITLSADHEIAKIRNPITGQELKSRTTTQGLRFRPKPVREHTLLVIE